MRRLAFLMVLVLPALVAQAADSALNALLSNSCLDCHDDATEKGGLSLETVDFAVSEANAKIWAQCLEQIENRFMPPPDKAQPTDEAREAAILELENRLVAYHTGQPKESTQAVLRRLNRTEYRNTIRDLFRMESGQDPTAEFPGDQRSHGFATNGEKLVTSSFLLRQYLEAAEEVIARAIHFEPKPDTRVWKMKPPFDRTTGQEISQAASYFRKIGEPQPYQDLCQRIGAGGAPFGKYHPLDDVSDNGAPVNGWYRVRILAEAKFRHALEQERFKRWPSLWDESEPIRLSLSTATLQGIDPENREARDFAATHEQASQRHIATWDLPDDERVWLECRMWLEKGQFPRLGFPNGPTNSNYRMNTYFKELAKDTLSPEAFAEFEERGKKHGGWISFHFGESPRVRLYEIELEGPLNEIWPPASHRVVFGDEPYDASRAREILRRFAERAWRRPVEDGELTSILLLVEQAGKNGMSDEAAIQEALKAVLCSPAFIYREERREDLDDYEIASRLSYFLTASMPDEPLLELAATGELRANLGAQAERLLSSPRSDAFVNEFLDGWLHLHELGSMAPDPHRFRVYYDDRLEPAMRRETRVFFRHLIETNGLITNLLDSDYTFANKELAALYRIKPEEFAQIGEREVDGLPGRYLRQDGVGNSPTTRFARIPLTDRKRGGVLGHASVLTLTANGVDTSPVIRGVWLLENILGTPPSPPPPDVPAIEPDIRGATTIREQLEKHRESSACSSCHNHIDPPGFALESFDPIGKWRGHYRVGNPYPRVDPSGRFGGTEFSDVVGFKATLLEREDAFVRCLLEELLIHALGRDLEITDRPAIREILAKSQEQGDRLRDLVVAVVESPLFARK